MFKRFLSVFSALALMLVAVNRAQATEVFPTLAELISEDGSVTADVSIMGQSALALAATRRRRT